MKRREFLKIAATGVVSTSVLGCASLDTGHKARKKPNIIVIYADDLGYGDVGCYGATKVQTPNIDRLANQGRMFTDAHSASAVCTPSRYSLLTGQYGWRVGSWGPMAYDQPMIIETDRLTVPGMLKQNGYSTACIGKWHLGFGEGEKLTDWNKMLKPGPLEIGFDYYFGVPLVNSNAPFVYVENHHVVGLDANDPFILRQENEALPPNTDLPRSPVEVFPEKGGLERWSGAKHAHLLYRDERVGTTLTEKSVEWLRTHHDKKKDAPFFMYLATTNIHHPYTPHPRFKGTSQCGRYGDFIHELDWIVGRIMETLDDLKWTEDTLVIFASDNGGMLNEGGKDAWKAGHKLNSELLGFKFGAWEGGHRVPFIARWPGHIRPASCSDQLICSIDMMATFSAILGHSLKPGQGPDSYNMLPALTGEPKTAIRDHLVMAPYGRKNMAIRSGKWLYIGAQGSGGFGGDYGGPGAVAWANQTNSDITPEGQIREDAPAQQLYDLEADISQTQNTIREHPEVAMKLKKKLQDIQKNEQSRQ